MADVDCLGVHFIVTLSMLTLEGLLISTMGLMSRLRSKLGMAEFAAEQRKLLNKWEYAQANDWAIFDADPDPPSFQWTPMLAFRSWRGVSDEYDASGFPGILQTRGG